MAVGGLKVAPRLKTSAAVSLTEPLGLCSNEKP